MPYRVQLQNFEGPLDLLLFLIKKNEVDIYDIPVAEITRQYMEYLAVIELLDLENAGDFILMAATLIRIKAQMLLPRPELDDEEAEDPRHELVQRLLEYQQFKDVATNLSELEHEHRDFYARAFFEHELEEGADGEDENALEDVKLFDLMRAFIEVLKKQPPQTDYTVQQIPVSVDEQADFILGYLESHEKALFTDLMSQFQERLVLIVSFIALLELVKVRRVKLTQNEPFADIWILRNGS